MWTEIRPEKALYPHFRRWIDASFPQSEALKTDANRSVVFSEDVSKQGVEHGGLWSRPDLAAAVFAKGKYKPDWSALLYSFEVKTYSGLESSAVYEAFAHTRYVNYSYLCWQSPDALDEKSRRIIALCKEYGLGVVTCSNPKSLNSFQVRISAKYQEIDTQDFDDFIEQRFGTGIKRAISQWLSANGWNFPDETRGLT